LVRFGAPYLSSKLKLLKDSEPGGQSGSLSFETIGSVVIASEARTPIPASVVLQRLHDEVPADHFTLGWLMGSLQKRSFGIIILILALVAFAPGISIAAGMLLMIPAFQMMAGKPAPVFPRCVANRSLPTRHLAALVQQCLPGLRYLETVIHPRWQTPLGPTKRIVGIVVALLSATLGVSPIPFSNVVPASAVVLISIAYLEEDGFLLSIALSTAVIALVVAIIAVWGTAVGAKWIVGLW
jgi:hypothetical protein